jgi:hypothetical protein
MARNKGIKIGLLDRLTELVKARADANPIGGPLVLQSHKLRREHAEDLTARDIAVKLKHEALEAYHRSSGRPVINITPELALVIAARLMPADDLSKSDYELIVSSGHRSLSAAARAHGIDRRTLRNNLKKHEIPNPWTSID